MVEGHSGTKMLSSWLPGSTAGSYARGEKRGADRNPKPYLPDPPGHTQKYLHHPVGGSKS